MGFFPNITCSRVIECVKELFFERVLGVSECFLVSFQNTFMLLPF